MLVTTTKWLTQQHSCHCHVLMSVVEGFSCLLQIPEMKKQDTEESAPQGSEDAAPESGGAESPAAAKDSSDSNSPSPKESEPQTPQTETPPQSQEAGSEGKAPGPQAHHTCQ